MQESAEEVRILVHDYEFSIEKKLLHLTRNMKETAEGIHYQREQIRRIEDKEGLEEQQEQEHEQEEQSSFNYSRHLSTN